MDSGFFFILIKSSPYGDGMYIAFGLFNEFRFVRTKNTSIFGIVLPHYITQLLQYSVIG